jgi:hypothetical protein
MQPRSVGLIAIENPMPELPENLLLLKSFSEIFLMIIIKNVLLFQIGFVFAMQRI